jgi:hypothetical protein
MFPDDFFHYWFGPWAWRSRHRDDEAEFGPELSAIDAVHTYYRAVQLGRSADSVVRQFQAWKTPERLNQARRCVLDVLHHAAIVLKNYAALASLTDSDAPRPFVGRDLELAVADLKRLIGEVESHWPEVTAETYEQELAANYDRWVGGGFEGDESAITAALDRVRRGEARELRDVIRELQGTD